MIDRLENSKYVILIIQLNVPPMKQFNEIYSKNHTLSKMQLTMFP